MGHIVNECSPQSLELLKTEVRTATTSMTSVPKPFKFLKDHYQSLVDLYEKLEVSLFKKQLADFLSVLSMTYSVPEQRVSLKFLQEGTLSEFKSWGHEYLSHLASDIGAEYQQRVSNQEGADDLIELVNQIVPQFMDHNQEHDAIDLLMEVEKLDCILQYVNPGNIQRLLSYLLSTTPYTSDQDELDGVLNTSFRICLKGGVYTSAIKIALRIDQPGLVEQVLAQCQDPVVQKQIMFQLARHRFQPTQAIQDNDQLFQIASNSLLSSFYLHLAKDLDVVDPKTPEQVYKSHLEETKDTAKIDSAKTNLAWTYTNAFVNAGFKKDALMSDHQNPWIQKVKNDGVIAAVASIGMVNLWNSDNGSNEISEYLDLSDIYTKAGAALGVGLFYTGLTDENDPAFALLQEKIDHKEDQVRIGAVMGLGIAYAGSARQDIQEMLVPLIVDTDLSVELSAMAALSLGLVFVGKCTEDIASAIIQTLCESDAPHSL